MSSVKYNQAKNINLRLAVPTAALASVAIGGAAVQPPKAEAASKATPLVRPLESFKWLSGVNWSKEIVDLVPLAHLKPHTKPKERHLTLAQQAARLVSPKEMHYWDETASCEEGGNWHAFDYLSPSDTSAPSGGLGIRRYNWVRLGGLKYASIPGRATPAEQVVIDRDIVYSRPYTISEMQWRKYDGTRFSSTFSSATHDERNAVEQDIYPGYVPEQNGDCYSY